VESLIKDSRINRAKGQPDGAVSSTLNPAALDVRFRLPARQQVRLLTGFRDSSRAWMIRSCNIKVRVSNPEPLDATLSAGPGKAFQSVGRPGAASPALAAGRVWRGGWASRAAFHSGTRAAAAPQAPIGPKSRVRCSPCRRASSPGPRLRRYLEKISARGVVRQAGFFCVESFHLVQREGKALDEALPWPRACRSINCRKMKGGKRDRAFFLRDMFLEKVFREHGLVTRANNTRKLLNNDWSRSVLSAGRTASH